MNGYLTNKNNKYNFLFILGCVIFKMWIAKRSNQDKNKNFTYISHEKYLSRTEDPEDSSRKFNVYPEEKIVVRFLH